MGGIDPLFSSTVVYLIKGHSKKCPFIRGTTKSCPKNAISPLVWCLSSQSPLYMYQGISVTTVHVSRHISHHCTCIKAYQSPLYMYQGISVTTVSCIKAYQSPLYMYQGISVTTVHVSRHISHHCTCIKVYQSPLYMYQGISVTTVHVSRHISHHCTCIKADPFIFLDGV